MILCQYDICFEMAPIFCISILFYKKNSISNKFVKPYTDLMNI